MNRLEAPLSVLATLLIASMLACDYSMDAQRDMRRTDLLKTYPPGKTSRVQVRAKLATEPDFSEIRPEGGWERVARPDVRMSALASEERTGKTVQRSERYWGPDPTRFLGLEYKWFFYDEADLVTDVDWQYCSD